MLIYAESTVYLLKERDPVGLSPSRTAGFPKWTVLIGGTGFNTYHIFDTRPDTDFKVTGDFCEALVRGAPLGGRRHLRGGFEEERVSHPAGGAGAQLDQARRGAGGQPLQHQAGAPLGRQGPCPPVCS